MTEIKKDLLNEVLPDIPQPKKTRAAQIVDDFLTGKITLSQYQEQILEEFERRKELLDLMDES